MGEHFSVSDREDSRSFQQRSMLTGSFWLRGRNEKQEEQSASHCLLHFFPLCSLASHILLLECCKMYLQTKFSNSTLSRMALLTFLTRSLPHAPNTPTTINSCFQIYLYNPTVTPATPASPAEVLPILGDLS